MLLVDYLTASAARGPSRPAVVSERGALSYGALLEGARKIAAGLRASGLEEGDRVVLCLDNSIEYVLCYFGILLAGGVIVARGRDNRARHMGHVIRHSGAAGLIAAPRNILDLAGSAGGFPRLRFLFCAAGAMPRLTGDAVPPARTLEDILAGEASFEGRPRRREGDLAQIIYTSGTTGDPKGVMLSHGNLRANTGSIVSYLGLGEEDRVMAVLPFYYSYGHSLLLTPVACGGSLVIDNRFAYPGKVLERMAAEEVTGFAGVPSTFAILLHKTALKDTPLPRLRYVTQAGGPMSPALARELQDALPRARIFIMYGQTEASARLSYLDPDKLFEKAGSIGKAIPGVELRVLNRKGEPVASGEAGEIVARGENVMMGYWKNARATRKVLGPEGLRTGDLATVDEEGYLYIVSRKSDMIKSGAHRITPKEIEEVIMEDGRVHEVAVVGESDELMGENVVALVVRRPGARITEREVGALCRRNLPLYKVPKRVEFRKALPKSPSGKIRRSVLRREFERVRQDR